MSAATRQYPTKTGDVIPRTEEGILVGPQQLDHLPCLVLSEALLHVDVNHLPLLLLRPQLHLALLSSALGLSVVVLRLRTDPSVRKC